MAEMRAMILALTSEIKGLRKTVKKLEVESPKNVLKVPSLGLDDNKKGRLGIDIPELRSPEV